MSVEADLLGAFEIHSPDDITRVLAAGGSATLPINGKTPLECLVEGYLRSPRFAECIRTLTSAGATFTDPLLEAVLLDDDITLRRLLGESRDGIERKLHVASAFTSCMGITPLHLCAEFNSVRCALALLEHGAVVDSTADIDADGIGGQTPLFHAVNSIHNHCRPVMELLVEAGARLSARVKGLIWGPGQEWETLVVDVTPLSYAQCGLYSQFHRRERDVYSNLDYLYRHRHGVRLPARNVPNRYLAQRS